MARKINIGEMNAKVTADAQPYIDAMNKAESATKQKTSSMEAQIDRFSKNLRRKFSAASIGGSIMQGLGIGTGFTLATQAAGLLVDHFRQAAEYAKKIEESLAGQLKSTLELISARRTDAQNVDQMIKDMASLEKKRKELLTPTIPTLIVRETTHGDEYDRGWNLDPKKLLEAAEVAKQMQELALKIQHAQSGMSKKEDASAGKEYIERHKALTDALGEQEDAFDALIKKQRDSIDKTEQDRESKERLAEAYRELADPLREYQKRLAEVESLRLEGILSGKDAAGAVKSLRGDAIEKALDRFFGESDKLGKLKQEMGVFEQEMGVFEQEMAAMWSNVSNSASEAFADMVIDGKASFSALADIIARSLIQITAQMAIINPLMNMVFGGFTGFTALPSFFPKRAMGGPVSAGEPYLVGEEGPELMVPRSAGNIVPNGQFGGSSNSFVFNIDARGADVGAVARLEQWSRSIENSLSSRITAVVRDNQARRI